MFCVECGKEGLIYRNGSCINCYLKNKQFSKGPYYLDIYTCPTCNAYKYKNTWINESFETFLHRLITDSFVIDDDFHNVQITTSYEQKDRTVTCNIKISGQVNGHQIIEEHAVVVRLRRETCESCSRQSGGYYEAILQIRSEQRKLGKQELRDMQQYVEQYVQNQREKGNRALFITDFTEEHGGIDFYLSDKGAAFTLSKKLYEQFGGEVKQSSKNIGMKDSRQLYRMTYLVRFPSYRKGDFIVFQDKVYYISSLHETTVHALELSTWTKRIFSGKDLQKVKVLDGKDQIREMIVVSQSPDEVQLMNPINYTIFHVRKPEPVLFASEKIKTIQVDDVVYLLPEKNLK